MNFSALYAEEILLLPAARMYLQLTRGVNLSRFSSNLPSINLQFPKCKLSNKHTFQGQGNERGGGRFKIVTPRNNNHYNLYFKDLGEG